MGCGKYGLISCILNCSNLFSCICCLIGIILAICLSVGNLEVFNTCGLILNSYLNLNVSLVEAEGYGLKNLIHDRGAILDGYVVSICDGLIKYELGCILGCCILCKVCVVKSDVVDCINVELHTIGIESPYIAILCPVSCILCILCVTLRRNIYGSTGDILCGHVKNYFLSLEVMLGNLNGCNSVSFVVVAVSCFVVIIGNIEYRSNIIDMNFLGVGAHSVGGTVGVRKFNHIIVIAGQSDFGFPLVSSINLSPGNILSNIIYSKYRCRSCSFIICSLKAKVEVCFGNSELNLGLALGIVNVVVFSYLIISKGPLVFQSGCNGICYNHTLLNFFGIICSFVHDLNGNSATCVSFNCMCRSKYIFIIYILNCSEFFSCIGCLIRVIISVFIHIRNYKVINAGGNIFCCNSNNYIGLIETECNIFKDLINNRCTVFNLDICCIRHIDDELIYRIVACRVFSKIGTRNIYCVNCINVKIRKLNCVNIAIMNPICIVLNIFCITLGRDIYISTSDVLCFNTENYILGIKVAFSNCKGCSTNFIKDIILYGNFCTVVT